jgi:glutamate/aspartate transport system permease protein
MNLDFGVVQNSLDYLWKGMQYTLQLTATAGIGGLFFGTLLALARLSSIKPLSMFAAGYVNLMRSIPLVLYEGAYLAEVVRAGIQALPAGQMEAARALGHSHLGAMRLVILPQAFRNMIPVLLTQTIILFQDTSLVYVISATDFVGAASKIAQRDSRLVEMYLFVAIVYFVICYTLSFLVKRLQRRIAVIR